MLIQITSNYFCAGILNGEPAPILAYMRGWPLDQIARFCKAKGWVLEINTKMADKVTIDLVKANEGQYGTMYSARASNGEWYSFGKKEPPPKGSYVEIEWEANGKYKKVKNVNKLQGSQANTPISGIRTSGANLGKDDYWTRREERDIETQKRIELQSCRNSAIEMVSLLLTANAVPVPKKTAEQEGYIADLVQHYTDKFRSENSGKPVEMAEPTDDESGSGSEDDTSDATDTTDWN